MSSKNTHEKPMPLEGIRIVEFGTFIAGPGAGSILGDLGADVVKIESLKGDPLRREVLRFGKTPLALKDGGSLYHKVSNRNKKVISLDMKTERGREIFFRLVKDADVFITSFRQDTKARLGIDYTAIAGANPRIIYASVSGFGSEGPMRNAGAFDPLGLAASGMMFLGSAEPFMLPGGIMDQSTAIVLSHAILTALLARERQGNGQEIHVSLYGTGIWLMYLNLMVANLLSVSTRDTDLQRYYHTPLRNIYRCKDGKWIIGVHHPEDPYWEAFCEATGQTALLSDSRFGDGASRQNHIPELNALFKRVFATRTRDEWMEILLERGLIFSPVNEVTEIQKDPQALINNYIVDFDDPEMGKIKLVGYPVSFSANRAGTRSLAPTLGEHTHLILRQMGYTDDEIDTLKNEGVVK